MKKMEINNTKHLAGDLFAAFLAIHIKTATSADFHYETSLR
ncbi:hypothetical protein [Alteribacillus bidgolensis]|uniref:Uncharacterized protein n=1 Tax=Alteribacillus bidgolensis TaxID=930129 RepID=A0A1G8FSW9_9BACI|nr:hypothetical protein [Alteribacillus bidgolensis]SDH85207.1 hypothetical protein SAMN05216352_10370 [Alteribacillus bidgolensis]